MKFSVITHVYNREDCIGRCIESVLSQVGDFEVEHLIGYDKSSDSTLNEIKKYLDDPRLKLFILPEHGGINAARNKCISEASGDFIIILDSDDMLIKDSLLFITKTILRNNEFSYFLFAQNDRVPNYNSNPTLRQYTASLSYLDFLSRKVSGDFMHVIKSEIIKKYPFDENVNSYEFVYILRLIREAQKILFTKEVLVMRERNRFDSASKSTFKVSDTVIKREIVAYSTFIEWFKEDLKINGLESIAFFYINQIYIDSIMVNDKKAKSNVFVWVKEFGMKLSTKYKLVELFHAGSLLRYILRFKYYVLYSIFKKRIE